MGTFDSFYDEEGNEWQTKAFDCNLDDYRCGDLLPSVIGDYQVEVFGGPDGQEVDGLAYVNADVLTNVPVERDPSLPLIGYLGDILERGERNA